MLKLHDLMRAGSVKRFHMVNTTRIQNNAEHMYGVAVLAGEIGARLGLEPPAVASLVAAAIVHDAGEARSGDLPAMTKRRLRKALGKAFDDVMDQWDAPKPADLLLKGILKCADLLEAMIFLQEHKVGRHADAAMAYMMDDSFRFFDLAGEAGRISHQIWSEIQNAHYEI